MASSQQLISANEARRRLLEAARPRGVEHVDVAAAASHWLDRTVAADVHAAEAIPSFARSAVDGFAVRACDIAAATSTQPVCLQLLSAPVVPFVTRLTAGTAWPIATGGPVPPGSDTMVMLEHVALDGDAIFVTSPQPAGRNLVARGEDVGAGAVLVPRGHRLSARDIALLGAAGVTSLPLIAVPKVAVLSSGGELVTLGTPPGPGQVRDVNQPALCAATVACGATVLAAGIAADDPAVLANVVSTLVASHDLVLISGGTSVGRADHTAEALQRMGARLLFHGVAMRPGRPMLAAQMGETIVIGLPGVTAAALTVFAVFVRPLLARLAGRDPAMHAPVWARLATNCESHHGREDHVRVRIEERDGCRWAQPLTGTASSLSALATADGVAVIPAELAAVPAGALVQVLLF